LLRLPTSSITLADSLLRRIAVLLHLHQPLLILIVLSHNNVVIANLHSLTGSTTMTWHWTSSFSALRQSAVMIRDVLSSSIGLDLDTVLMLISDWWLLLDVLLAPLLLQLPRQLIHLLSMTLKDTLFLLQWL
jgi:hypothetical protein